MTGRMEWAGGELRVAAVQAGVALTQPAGEVAIIVDLAGVLNRSPAQDAAGPAETTGVRCLMLPDTAATLIVAVLNAARAGGEASVAALDDALEQIKRAGSPATLLPPPIRMHSTGAESVDVAAWLAENGSTAAARVTRQLWMRAVLTEQRRRTNVAERADFDRRADELLEALDP